MEGAAEQLQEAGEDARRAASGFAELAGPRDGEDRATLTSLQGEAVRIEGLARVFAALLSVWKEAKEGKITLENIGGCTGAAKELVETMTVIEESKPHWVVPATLQALSALLEFLEQLHGDLAEVQEGERKPAEVRWHVEKGQPS